MTDDVIFKEQNISRLNEYAKYLEHHYKGFVI